MNADTLFSYADYVINDKEQITEYTQKYFQDHKPEFLFKLFGYIRKCCHDQGDSYLLSSDMPVKDLLLDPDYFMAVSEWSYDTAAELADNAVHEFLENYFQMSITDNDFELVRTRADFFADIKIAASVGKFQNANWVIKDFFGVENMSVKKCIDTIEAEQIRQQDIDDQMIADYITRHAKEIAEEVNKNFDKQKLQIRDSIIESIRSIMRANKTCLDIIQNDESEDQNITIGEFFSYEYSAYQEYICHNSVWSDFNEELSYDTLEIGWNIMVKTIKNAIQKKFNISLSDERLDEVKFLCYDFDDVYTECRDFDFFCAEPVIEFAGIKDWPLFNLLETHPES